MDNKESLYNSYLEAKKQVEIYTDKMLQLKDTFKVLHAKFIVGEEVIAVHQKHDKSEVHTRCIVKSVSTKIPYLKDEFQCCYLLLKIKKDGTPSKNLYYQYPIEEDKILKVEN